MLRTSTQYYYLFTLMIWMTFCCTIHFLYSLSTLYELDMPKLPTIQIVWHDFCATNLLTARTNIYSVTLFSVTYVITLHRLPLCAISLRKKLGQFDSLDETGSQSDPVFFCVMTQLSNSQCGVTTQFLSLCICWLIDTNLSIHHEFFLSIFHNLIY